MQANHEHAIQINDRFTKLALLENIIKMTTDTTGVNQLLTCGVMPELLDILRDRPLPELMQLSEMLDVRMFLSLDCKSVIAAAWRIDAIKRNKFLQEYFVANGATMEMCLTLFSMSTAHFREWRRLLCSESLSARGAKPSIQVCDAMHETWNALLKSEPDLRERYYLLHKQYPGYSFASLWNAITEFNERNGVRNDNKECSMSDNREDDLL